MGTSPELVACFSLSIGPVAFRRERPGEDTRPPPWRIVGVRWSLPVYCSFRLAVMPNGSFFSILSAFPLLPEKTVPLNSPKKERK